MKRANESQRPMDARARRWRLNELSAIALLVLTVVVAAVVAPAASSERPPQSLWQQLKPGKTTRPERCPSARKALVFYRQAKRAWDRKREVQVSGQRPGLPKSCARVRQLVLVYRENARNAHKAYEAWHKRELRHLLREQSDWLQAVQEAQKAYPGTAWWLRSCSHSEGGWGRWVPNTGGSGAGGWLQFMEGTFRGFNRHALDDVRAKGYRVPLSATSWHSPLGQALAGGWAYRKGLTYHWYGGGCS